MQRSGSADLALMGGQIPGWLFERMTRLSLPLVEAILIEYGQQEFLRRLSDPFWFQSFGAVIGMDWNSSGVTTAVMSALKKALNPHALELGLYVCGGKGKHSLQTPNELINVGERTGLDGHYLAQCSKLSAKVDNTAIQDGFQLYLHSFVVSDKGDWSVVQQGMQPGSSTARRYHWHSAHIQSFVQEPHTAICGDNQGTILNLVHREATPTQQGILAIAREDPAKILKDIPRMDIPGMDIPRMTLPTHHEVRAGDVDLKRLGSILWLAQEQGTATFEELLLLKGLGPRTLQSLTLVSEVIHGTLSRFTDPARFAFAHGSKGGKPFPVPTRVYDETIATLRSSVEKAKLGESDKHEAIKKLTKMAQAAEKNFEPNDGFEDLLRKENEDAWKHGGRTIHGYSRRPNEE